MYLIINNPINEVEEFLEVFSNQLGIGIEEYYRWISKEDRSKLIEIIDDGIFFKKKRFVNPSLEKLIKGQENGQLYYDPEVQRLKEKIKHYKYCSANDYIGVLGPVVVTVKK